MLLNRVGVDLVFCINVMDEQHNVHMPHSAFQGQTPDEMYFGTGGEIPQQLEDSRIAARVKWTPIVGPLAGDS